MFISVDTILKNFEWNFLQLYIIKKIRSVIELFIVGEKLNGIFLIFFCLTNTGSKINQLNKHYTTIDMNN